MTQFEFLKNDDGQRFPEMVSVAGSTDDKKPEDLDGYSDHKKPKDSIPPIERGAMTDEEFAMEVKKRTQELQRLVDGHKRLFASFAGDHSLNFMLSDGFYFLPEKGEIHIDTTWFFREGYTQEQIIWACFHELGHFRDMIADPEAYLENFAYIRRQAKNVGKTLEQKWREKYGEDDPTFIEDITRQRPVDKDDRSKGMMSKIEMSAYNMLHQFWNVMDDIYVNNTVRNRAGRYARGSEADRSVVRRLYREKLFVENDYTNLVNPFTGEKIVMSRHAQFINKLLRDEMVYDENVVVSDEVQNVLDQKRLMRGEEYTVQSLIDARLKPIKGVDTKPGTRYALLKRTLEPIFMDLLMKDIAEMDFVKPEKQEGAGGTDAGEPGESSGQSDPSSIAPDEPHEGHEDTGDENDNNGNDNNANGGEERGNEDGANGEGEEGENNNEGDNAGDNGDDNNANGEGNNGERNGKEGDITPEDLNPFSGDFPDEGANPDQFSEKDIQDFIEHVKQAKNDENRHKKMTPQERAQEEYKKKQLQWDTENEITAQERKEFDAIVEKITPYLDDLVELWKSIAYGKGRSLEVRDVGYFNRGDLDVNEAVRQFPNIVNATQTGELERVKVYTRKESKEILSTKPELIKVQFLGDLSHSMDAEKRQVLKEAMALVLLSLKEFNAYLDRTRKETGTKLRVETEAWVFGTNFVRIKEPQRDYGSEQQEIIKSVTSVNNSMGLTRDFALLQKLRKDMTPQEQVNITQKKTMEIIFEVTDGVPFDGHERSQETRAEVDALVERGVIVRGFQIGNVSLDDQKTFNSIWNDERPEPLGVIVGSDIAKLPQAVAKILKKYLGAVKI